MYCTRCGKEIRSDQKFCGNCGAKNVNYQEKNDLKEMIEKAVAGEENALEKIYNLTYVQGFAIALQMVKMSRMQWISCRMPIFLHSVI